jgi:phage tail-like protein
MAVLSSVSGGVGFRSDPVLAHNFVVSLLDTSSSLAMAKSIAVSAILDVALGGFTECSGLEMSLDIEEYKEGGRNGEVLKFPTRVKWSNITLKKGVGAGTGLWDWHYGFVEGRGKRRDGVIVLLDDLHLPNNIWYFRRGLPVKYTGPTMNASQNSVAIETIEIAHEGIYQLPYVGLASAAAAGIANIAG